MRRLALFLIGLSTPPAEREWVVGDIVEELDRIDREQGHAAATRWLLRETRRVVAHAPRHRLAVRRTATTAARGDGAMTAIGEELRHAFRLLRRSPGFAVIAIATLALGLGANTAMFAVVNAVLLKPLPFEHSDRLMLVHMLFPDRVAGPGVYRESVWSYPKYRTFLELQHVFERVAMFASRDVTLSGDREPERVRGEVTTEGYQAVLGVGPVLGRTFTHAEADQEGSPPVALLGHGLWTRRYGADPSILGRAIQVNGTAYTVIGVLPRGFRGLSGNAEIWMPLAVLEPGQLSQRFSHSYTIVARRKPGVGEQEASAAVRVHGWQIDKAYRDDFSGEPGGASAASLYASRADADVRRASFVLLGAVGFVLLIACVNLTNLLTAKAIARRRDLAIRVAIGASRARIARQFIVESAALAGLGALAGLVVAGGMLAATSALLPDSEIFFRTSIAPGAPRIAGAAGLTRIGAGMIGFDFATLLFSAGLAVVTALMVAIVPAVQASSVPPFETLKQSGSSTARGFHGYGARTMLVGAQIALAVILLAGAGLLIRSTARLGRTGIGVTSQHVLTLRFDLPRATYTNESGLGFYARLMERVRAIPGVESAALANCPPVSGGCNATSIWLARQPRAGVGRDPLVGIHWATPEYFSTLGIQLVKGRVFNEHDRAGQPKVALLNETAARTLWPNQEPIGKIIGLGQGGFHEGGAEVIGVVSDVRYNTIETAARPDAYIPLAQSYQPRMRLFVRSRLDRAGLVAAIGREVRGLDPNLPLSEVKTMDERLADAMWRTRVSAWLLTAFAGAALLLTAIGIFGVMTQVVVQRTAEIGIRMALGAQQRDVLGVVLGRAAVVTAAGLAIGVGFALALTRLMTTLLYDVRPHDPATFVIVAVVLGAVALVACYMPARRATRIDAVVALRSE
jgi:putative ABC transport system permease protein